MAVRLVDFFLDYSFHYTCKAARPTTYRRKEKRGEQRQNPSPRGAGRGAAEARPGHGAGTPPSLQTKKGTSPLHSRLWQQSKPGREPGTKSLPQAHPWDMATEFCTEVDQQAHCPSASDHQSRRLGVYTISAPCILFFRVWPEGVLGTQTSDLSSLPTTDKPSSASVWTEALPHAMGLLSAQREKHELAGPLPVAM